MKLEIFLGKEKHLNEDSIDLNQIPDYKQYAKLFGYTKGKCCMSCKFSSSDSGYPDRIYCDNEIVKQKISLDPGDFIDDIAIDPTYICKYYKG